MSWEAHRVSVLAAQVKLNQVHAAILAAAEEQDVALESVALAVGPEPGTDTARIAFASTAGIAEHLNRALVAVNSARDAMLNYSREF